MGEKPPVMLLRLQAAYENGERQRTSLKRWMMDNYEDFSEKLDDLFPSRINWIWLTQWFQENGFRNRDGSDLKKDTVQKVWRRVVEDRAKARPRRSRAVREIGEAAMAGRNDLFRVAASPEKTSQPVVRVEQTVPRSLPQAAQPGEVAESGKLSPAERANALMLAEMDKRSGRG